MGTVTMPYRLLFTSLWHWKERPWCMHQCVLGMCNFCNPNWLWASIYIETFRLLGVATIAIYFSWDAWWYLNHLPSPHVFRVCAHLHVHCYSTHNAVQQRDSSDHPSHLHEVMVVHADLLDNNERGEHSDFAVDLTLPESVVHPVLVLAQEPNALSLTEWQLVLTRCHVVVDCNRPRPFCDTPPELSCELHYNSAR